jgi:hypothetical protein
MKSDQFAQVCEEDVFVQVFLPNTNTTALYQ